MMRGIAMQKWRRGLLMASLAALGVMVFTPLAQAASTVAFNPSGTGFGAGTTSTVFNVSSFTYDNGNALFVNGNTAIANFTSNGGSTGPLPTTTQFYFQSTLGTVNGSTASGSTLGVNNNTIAILPHLNALPPTAASADITINNSIGTQIANLSKQIVLAGNFTEQVTSVGPSGPNTQIQFADASPAVLSASNMVTLYIQNAGTANELAGTGFPGPGATAILQGHLVQGGFGSTFTSSFSYPTSGTGSPSNPVKFDQYSYTTGGSPGNYSTGGPGGGPVQSVSGSGSTNFQVQVDSYNSLFFANPPTIIGLSFNPISLALAFLQDPAAALVQGQTPHIGNTNGGPIISTGIFLGGPDLMVQTLATNAFAIPEPSSVTLAATGIGLVSLARLWRRRRRSKVTAV
jgi:hypothetical protein